MALRGYELILFVRAQNQASATLRRVANDVRALSKVEDLQRKRERLSIQQGKKAAQLLRTQQQLRELGPGGAKTLALQKRQAELAEKQVGQARALKQIEDGRFRTNTKILRNRERELSFAERAAKFRTKFPGEALPDRLRLAQAANARQLVELNREMNNYGAAEKAVAARGKTLAITEAQIAAAARQHAEEIKRLSAAQRIQARDMGLINQGLLDLDRGLRMQKWERLQNMGRTISHIGRAAQLTGLVTTAAFGAMAKSAADFESKVALAASQARDINAPLSQVATRTKQIDAQIKGLMRTFPASSDEMADSAYEIYSGMNLFEGGVVNTSRALEAMQIANEAAVGGQADLADSTSLLITLANNFGGSVDEMKASMDTAFDVIRFGRLHMSDLNDMMNKIAPAAKGSGQSFDDLAGSLAYLTTVVPSQRQVATGMARLLDLLRHPDIVLGFKRFGVNIKDAAGNMRDFPDIMDDIINRFPELASGQVSAADMLRTISQAGREARTGRPGIGLTFTIEGRRMLDLLIKGWDEAQKRNKQVMDNIGERQRAFDALNQSSGVRFKRFTNNLKRQMLDVGAGVIPVFEEMGRHIGRLSKWWDTIDAAQKKNLTRWAAYAGIFLIVGGLAASVVGALTAMAGTFGIFFSARGLSAERLARFGKFAGLLKLVKGLGTIGVISVLIKTAITGEAGAKTLLTAALSGAMAGGAIGGPVGALIGAITVPIAVSLVAEFSKPPQTMIQDLIQKEFVRGRRGRYSLDASMLPSREEIQDNWTRILSNLGLYNIFATATRGNFIAIAEKARREGKITGEQFAAAMRLAMAAGLSQAEADLAFARQVHDRPTTAEITGAKKSTAQVNKARETARNKDLTAAAKYYSDLAKYNNAERDNAVNNADRISDARKAAMDQVVSFLMSKYQEIEQANQQVMGSLFQGEWMTGRRAQISDDWGIKATVKDLIRDMRDQLSEFNRFNAGLESIAKRGGPPELIEELRKLGPAGLEQIEALKKATPEEWRMFVSTYKRRNAQIDKATKIQFNKQLKEWRKHGGNMMEAIISGLDAKHAKLEAYFQKMVSVWFPGFISQAVAEAQAELDKEKPTGPKKPTMPAGLKSGRVTRAPSGNLVYNEGDVTVNVNGAKEPVVTGRKTAKAVQNAQRDAHPQRKQISEDWGITSSEQTGGTRRGGR